MFTDQKISRTKPSEHIRPSLASSYGEYINRYQFNRSHSAVDSRPRVLAEHHHVPKESLFKHDSSRTSVASSEQMSSTTTNTNEPNIDQIFERLSQRYSRKIAADNCPTPRYSTVFHENKKATPVYSEQISTTTNANELMSKAQSVRSVSALDSRKSRAENRLSLKDSIFHENKKAAPVYSEQISTTTDANYELSKAQSVNVRSLSALGSRKLRAENRLTLKDDIFHENEKATPVYSEQISTTTNANELMSKAQSVRSVSALDSRKSRAENRLSLKDSIFHENKKATPVYSGEISTTTDANELSKAQSVRSLSASLGSRKIAANNHPTLNPPQSLRSPNAITNYSVPMGSTFPHERKATSVISKEKSRDERESITSTGYANFRNLNVVNSQSFAGSHGCLQVGMYNIQPIISAETRNGKMITLYHYTTDQSANTIRREKVVRSSTTSTPWKYRQHGCGVYFTSLNPYVGPKQLVLNNFTNGGTHVTYGLLRKISSVVEITFYEHEVEKINSSCRNIYLYRGSIDLKNYEGRYRIYENPNNS